MHARREQFIQFGRKLRIFLAKGPSYHYIYGMWRLKRLWATHLPATTSFDNSAFLSHLNSEIPQLAAARQIAQIGSEADSIAALAAYFRERTQPAFFFSAAERADLVDLIDPAQRQVTIQAADQICNNIFVFRGSEPVTFTDQIDWFCNPQDNTDWRWDLNRHTIFEVLGRAYWYTQDEKYALKFKALLLDWLAQNPAGPDQANWSSVFEVAFRVNTWIWAFFFFRDTAAFDDQTSLAFLKGLLAHGLYLDTHLELHVQNNHLLLEAKSLALIGLLFPEFQQAARWRQRGLQILYQEIERQVCTDGVHGERATLYHRVIAGELLEVLVLLENNQITAPQHIVERFSNMVIFERWVTKPDGTPSLLGDSALEDTYLRFPAASAGPVFLGWAKTNQDQPDQISNEAAVWLLGPTRLKAYEAKEITTGDECHPRAFPEGGYFIMRQGQDQQAPYLIFDCGPFAYDPVPSHGHADALSFELYANGRTLLVDPGVYSTRLGHAWRNYFRGSRAHNTVVVDQQDQSQLLDIWRVDRPAQAHLQQWSTDDQFDFVDGSHNGYERLPQPVTHRRQIFFNKPEYWIVVDWLSGQGDHCFDLYYQLMTDLQVSPGSNANSFYAESPDGSGLAIAALAPNVLTSALAIGETDPIQGWVSLRSAEKEAAYSLRYRQEASAPVQFCTVLYPYIEQRPAFFDASLLAMKIDGRPITPQDGLLGVRIETAIHLDYFVLDVESGTRLKQFEAFETDASLLFLRYEKSNLKMPTKSVLRGGSILRHQERALAERELATGVGM